MKQIKLTQGKFALVDDSDFDWLSKWNWCANKTHKQWRAQRSASADEMRAGMPSKILMHRFILGYPASEVDHRDRNSLNNQRENLRLANHGQQMANSRTRPTGRLRGVRPHHNPICKLFTARIRKDGKEFHLGCFSTENEAGLAYDTAARKLHGEFAVLNYPAGRWA